MAFDDIFNYTGGMGCYQIALFFIVGFQCFYEGYQAMGMIFLGPDQDHWCGVEQLETLQYHQQKLVAIPHNSDDEEYEKCLFYDMDYDNYSVEEFCQWEDSDENVTTAAVACSYWVYDYTHYAKTAVSDYDLVCDRAFLVGVVYSSYVAGILFAAFFAGIASDYFGRKTVLSFSVIFQIVFALVAAVAPSYGLFLTSRFLMAFCISSGTNCAFVIITEFVGPKYRVLTGTLFCCCYAVGYMLLPCIAYFVTDFRYLQIILALIMVPALLFFWLVPESPRWLVDNNKTDKAIDILGFMAEVNKKPLPSDVESVIKVTETKVDEKEDVIFKKKGKWTLLCSNSILRKTIIIIVPAWIGSAMVYNGLSFNIGDLSGDLYLNTFIFGFIEIPSNFLALLLIYVIGRRRTQFLSLTAAGAFCLLCVPFVNEDGSAIVTSLALVGKAFITGSYTTIFLCTAEMFPTPVRHISHGICNTCGNLAGMLAPFMGAPLIAVWLPLPLVIFGLIGIITGPLILLLPEISGKSLPDSIAEAEDMWTKSSSISPTSERTEKTDQATSL